MFELGWLAGYTVKDIPLKGPRGRKVTVIDSRMTVSAALDLLSTAQILSAPVWDQQRSAFIASLDMRDVVNLIANSLRNSEHLDHKVILQVLSSDDQFNKLPLCEVFDFSKDFEFFAVNEDADLFSIVKQMVEAGDRHHRRALVFAEGKSGTLEGLISMVSQSAIIEFIQIHRSRLGAGISTTLADSTDTNWEESRSKVISVPSTCKMIDALTLMQQKSISGLAVLDDHAHLLGTVGSRDLKGLIVNHQLDLTRLRLTAREYINYIKQLSVEEKHPAISVKKTDSVSTLIGKFASTHVHRIFVVDDHNCPIGVLSTVDVLSILYKGYPRH